MGDTGSLALGGLLGYIAVVIRQELLLVPLRRHFRRRGRQRHPAGRLVQIHAASDSAKAGGFSSWPRCITTSRRKGWAETQVVVRFWLIGAMLAMLALATIKLR